METNFVRSLKFVLIDEGGNDDDPHDHGGRTSRGITQREYTAWLKERELPDADVWQAPQQHIERIYHDEYWEPWCDQWPAGIDYCLFDMNVNAGPHRSTVLAQRALGLNQDGRIGPITRAALIGADPAGFINKFAEVKRTWYYSLGQPRFTKGWLNRVDHVRANALSMVS